MRIAVLEEDQAQADFISQTLSADGHVCRNFTSGGTLIQALQSGTFDLLMLDSAVPDMRGEVLLRWVRENVSELLPVLCTTISGCETVISSMLNAGADDYIVKPVAAEILLARVKSLLRRAYRITEVSKEVIDDVEFDFSARQVCVRGTSVTLMQKQFELARLLFRHLNQPLSRSHIRDVIWGQRTSEASRTIDTHIWALKTKLGLRPENGYRLNSIYRYGYRLEKLEQA
jgi:DNA-binding response OmpR family regulator